MDALGQLDKLKRGCLELISEDELKHKLTRSNKTKTPLRIKAGFDPTAADLHLGHTVLLSKLRQFQDLGHTVLFLIGDFTARIGDPSGQNKARPPMSDEDIKRNASTYKSQVYKILDPKKTEMVFNNDWFSKMSIYEFTALMRHASVSQIIAREDFQQRLKKQREIRINEFIYPLLQAYDSVHLKADLEIGGTDQKFNLLLGRELQRDYGQEEQVIMLLPLLEGTDGVHKMSKSLGNYIGINESPDEIFGKIMSISDALMYKYYELLTDEDLPEIKRLHPKEAKEKLAVIIISQYHSISKAQEAKSAFEKVFSHKAVPTGIPEYNINTQKKILDILTESGLVKSRNEARRLIQQGGVSFLDKKIKDENFTVLASGIIKAGSRRFLKVVI
ncbi:MAG: tyrosine--tRNA ligase [Omnitrophica WOR_2 bacterium RIFCSPHIGHO2_02_FULL_45_21]|nr:MAG: tyrosine--tRNA ligase [Omnitrophica WOR_2 bacterium RIFCSPHIGHO2_02_FULL_45_21]